MYRYRIVSNYGFGDITWLERYLTQKQVVKYFVSHEMYPKKTKFSDIPTTSDHIYYCEIDNIGDTLENTFSES